MKADVPSANTPSLAFPRRFLLSYEQETGQSLVPWVIVALLSFLAQIVFRRALAPGEFGTLNTVLGVVGLCAVPLLALNHAFTHYLAQNGDEPLQTARIFITELFTWAWGALSFALLLLLLPLLDLPRFSLELFALLNVFIVLGATLSYAISEGNLRLWGWLLVASVLLRVLVAAALAGWQPWAEAGLVAFLVGGLITLIPALRPRQVERDWLKTWHAIQNRKFLLQLGATFSVFLSIYLFSSADRFVAQSWFGTVNSERIPLAGNSPANEATQGYGIVGSIIDWHIFDGYQAAGLLGRALIWGTQPLLLVFFLQRSRLDRTTSASLRFLWIYLGTLFGGAILLGLLAEPLSWLFSGTDYRTTVVFIPGFALAMIPIGLLQGLGIFALASRRYPECFVLGASGVGYVLLLYLVSRQPQLMLTYMFGGAMVALMIVLFVGVVRWGRKPEQILWNNQGSSK